MSATCEMIWNPYIKCLHKDCLFLSFNNFEEGPFAAFKNVLNSNNMSFQYMTYLQNMASKLRTNLKYVINEKYLRFKL